ncbi:cyanophycinase [Cnuella takakiae]|uniref:Cyanophycinase n=1 Tax=Cnuella takakiae TaxID=1302690 RepID=A0A1M4SZB2_9BACT|nr:cyanophycinase [Cnuella takakiae]OLY90636.1 cyanophycinase [Cnuella takakiae]SHE37474.1 cyanophycinase [Cnuella takakiae]
MKQHKGYLVSIGGAEDKSEQQSEDKENSLDFLESGILKNVVELMQGKEPSIEVITTATARPDESFRNYKEAFEQLGCVHVGHLDLRDREAANEEAVMERIRNCNGVMFSGGDQARLSAVLGGSLLCRTLKQRYQQEHFVIAGTSAGAAAMSAAMMNGGSTEKANLKGEIDLSIGFGFISDVIIDTHFDARGRFARLVQAVAAQPGLLGIGLGEDTGVVVEKGSMLRAIGSSSVTIIDGTKAQYNNIADIKPGAPISIGMLGVYQLAHSDCFDLVNRTFIPVGFAAHQN